MSAAVEVVRQEQKGEGEEGVGPCLHELAGLQGGEDSGKDNGPVRQEQEEGEVGVAF